MTTLQFADTYNLVAFLTKFSESEGFEQIVDFLNAKTVNGEVQLQALVHGKKIVVTEASVRRDLQLEDANGVDCLPNATIFEQLTLIGYEKLSQKLTFYKAFFSPQWKFLIHTILQCLSAKTTTWNEFSSTMASVIICLATNQKFNFSKYIFESMVKNLDNAIKFLMYPRFIHVFLDNKLEGMSSHKRIYVTPSHTKKIFANMRRKGKDFSRRETPLFPTMVVHAQEEMGEGSPIPIDPHPTPIITQPSSSQPQRKQKLIRSKEKDTEILQSSVPSDPINIEDEAVTEEPSMQLKELIDFCTKLQQRVLDLENTKTAQAQEITSLKKRVKRLEKKGGSRTHKLKKLYRVGRSARVVSSKETSLGNQEDASKQGRKIDDIDADAEISLVDESQGRHDDDLIFDTVTTAGEVVTTANVEVSTASPTAATITNVELTLAQTLAELKSARPKTKGVVIQDPSESTPTISLQLQSQIKFDDEEALRLQAKFDEEDRLAREKAQQVEEANIAWDDIQAKVKADYQLAQRLQAQEQEEFSKRAGEALEQESSKKQKVDDDKETEELKQCMEIILDDGDDVTIEATPLSTKFPTIMLKNFDREDLEVLWSIVKARFKKTEPVNYMDTFLHLNLKTIVNCVTMQNVLYYLLVEKMYPLTKHTLRQMFNDVKLQVDYECEMAFELLRLGRIVRIKSLLEVTAVKLVLLVQKLLLLVLKVNAAGIKVTTAERIKTAQRKDKDCLCDMYEIFL
ncbi:hypothetical protein Tco_0716551 [Tanacetum coccineum]